MFRTLFVAAFVAAATATTWPMITVNSAGEIVLNSVSRASSFQLTPMSVTAGPTSSTTSSLTTVTALDDNVDTYIATVPTTLSTSGGFKLPAPTVGRTITLFNDGTAPATFTVWTSATTVFFGTTTSTTHVVPSTATWTTFTATDTTNWAVTSSEGTSKVLQTIGTGSGSAITLTEAELLGGFYTFTGSTAATLTTPTGSALEAANVQARTGDSFEFTLYNTGSVDATLTAGASGVTLTDSGLVNPGQRVSFRVIRTGASAYTIYRKAGENGRVNVFSKTSAYTLTTSDTDSVVVFSGAAATTFTLPSCSVSNVGVQYQFINRATTAAALTIAVSTGDFLHGYAIVGTAAVAFEVGATSLVLGAGNADIPDPPTAAIADTGGYASATCVDANLWNIMGAGKVATIS